MSITVLGSGVVGCSVALALRAAGYRVEMIGERRMGDRDARSHPTFASAYPAASIIPRGVERPGIGVLLASSEAIFEQLEAVPAAGVRSQRHLELFEVEEAVRLPTSERRDLEILDRRDAAEVPKRPGVDRIFGFSFTCRFCDMPWYGRWLDRAVDRSGVSFTRRRLEPTSLREIRSDVLVNCLGMGAASVFRDVGAGTFLRGLLVECPFEQPPGAICSYNYTPRTEVWARADGSPADVYFYPRVGHCVLGGTREPVRWDPDTGAFENPRPLDALRVQGIDVPRPILELNAELIHQLTGRRPGPPRRVLVGLRHLAGSASKPDYCLGDREVDGRPVVDCYGFGGAGVTLSWGAALRAAALCAELADPKVAPHEQTATARLARYLKSL